MRRGLATLLRPASLWRPLGDATSRAGIPYRQSKPALKRPTGATQRKVASHSALLAVLLSLAGAGCGVFHRHAPQPPVVLILQPPILLPSLTADPPMPPPPDFEPMAVDAPPQFPLGFIAPRPPLPRRAPGDEAADRGEHPAPASTPAPAPPQLTSLTPSQQDNYRRAALLALNRSQSDLRLLYNRRDLNPQAVATRAQADEYVHQAQQALAQGDLLRAQTLAEKAETLARFLLGR